MSRRKLTDAQVTVLALLAGGGHLIESGRYVCVRPRGLWVCHRQTFNALRARSLIHQAVKKNPRRAWTITSRGRHALAEHLGNAKEQKP